uniref:ANF_receptor domain-containing protein n=1 Tax=Steinernema glaseri TaxID=37863 RepID=A0A1I8ALP6_9BILA
MARTVFILLLLLWASGADPPAPAAVAARQQQSLSPAERLAALYKDHLPFNVLVVLPFKESNNDKFGLTMEKARPVIDIAVEDIIAEGILPAKWINLTYHDSRYWEDSSLAERHATTGVVQAYCEHRLDAILGFADSYSLATVAKVSAGFGNGVPVMTTAGMIAQIGSKKNFPYLTRMQGSYRQMADSIYQFLACKEDNDAKELNYKNLVFVYHDKRRALNRPQTTNNGEQVSDTASSHCYFSLYAIKNYFTEKSDYFKEAWKISTPHLPFDEEASRSPADVLSWLRIVSQQANGRFFILLGLSNYGDKAERETQCIGCLIEPLDEEGHS